MAEMVETISKCNIFNVHYVPVFQLTVIQLCDHRAKVFLDRLRYMASHAVAFLSWFNFNPNTDM